MSILGEQSVGNIVKTRVGGVARNLIVIHKGRPSALYGASIENGVWLLIEDLYINRAHNVSFGEGSITTTTCSMYDYLNYFFDEEIEDNGIRRSIISASLPYGTGQTGLNARIFPLSACEMGWETLSTSTINRYLDGNVLDYFADTEATDSRRIGLKSGTAYNYWTRSNSGTSTANGIYVNTSGGCSHAAYTNTGYYVRPAFILPSSIPVLDDGTIDTSGGSKIAYYIFERRVGVQPYQQIAITPNLWHEDTVPTSGTTYQARVKSVADNGMESAYATTPTLTIDYNTAPTVPPAIDVPLEVNGGEDLTVTWATAMSCDGSPITYKLEQAVDGGEYEEIYNGSDSFHTTPITKGWIGVAYRVRAYDSYGEESAYTESETRTVDNNTRPVITCECDNDIGSVSEGFSVKYQGDDEDGDEVTVTEMIDGVIIRSYAATLGADNSFDVTGNTFVRLLNGEHALAITATDAGGKAGTLALTFTKDIRACRITLENPLETDDLITKMVMSITRNIPVDAEFQVLVTNNGLDPEPVYEDATALILAGHNHRFENEIVENGHAFNFILTACRGASDQGGYIGTIGGAFE